MLRDHLVCGMNDTRIQRCHLSEPDLTFQKAFELIQAMESADKDTQDVRKAIEQPTQIHYVQKKTPPANSYPSSAVKCYHCGGSHLAMECTFRNSTCHFCHKQLHIVKVAG